MDVATAKPTPAERAAAPHHCLDLVDPDEPFSAADYRAAALDALHGIADRGGTALLVGGTGLYLRTVARGLPVDVRDADPMVRASLEERLAGDGLEPLLDELRTRDPAGAVAIDQHNPRRVVRALERAIISGTARPPEPEGYPAPVTWLGLRMEPPAHRARIRTRIEAHFAGGLLEEAASLRERYPEDLRAFSAMGYREAFDVLAGRCSMAEAAERDAVRTWAYVRRQRTWFRSEPGVTWLAAGEGAGAAARARIEPWLQATPPADYAGRR